jgi:D-alanyl-D-alanine carboxypeptidase
MLRGGAQVRRCLKWSALGLATLLVATAITGGTADARKRHHRRHHVVRYQPPTASIVVDANSGAVMEESHADSTRHPASLTKMMTLYLLFERLAAGKIKMSTPLEVSAHAAAQAPSKLGLKPGDTIQVEDAIKAIVTKSANDVAVVVGEAVSGGSETEFGRMMTAKARALGMMHTNYHNASGLPDDRQLTTARDQSILARALQDRFPQYFHFFSIRSFVWHGRAMRNHNHLLGRVAGVDGMKTGYIRDSGFNIVVDLHRAKRHLIAVVFGGRTARVRDAKVRGLIDKYVRHAATTRTAPMVVEGWKSKQLLAKLPTPARDPRDDDKVVTAAVPEPGSTAPIKPNRVKTVTVEPATMQTASLTPLPLDAHKLTPAPSSKVTTVATLKRTKLPPALPAEPPAHVTGGLPTQQVASAGDDVPLPPAAKAKGGYMIQVGAFDDEHEAKQRLVAAQAKAKDQLIKADPFTEKVAKGRKALYRARFAGLDRNQAETACKHLKRSDIPCLMLKN